MRISQNIYWLSGAPFGQLGNVFAVRYSQGLILIDSGQDEAALKTIQHSLVQWDLADIPITHLLLTHFHLDHAGNALYFQKLGAQVVCSEIDSVTVEKGGLDGLVYPYPREFPPCPVGHKLAADESFSIAELQVGVLSVPGHTNGSVFYSMQIDDKIVLFTGDTLSVQGNMGDKPELCWKGSPDYSSEKYLNSIAKVWTTPCDMILGGHGFPRLDHGQDILRLMYQKVLVELR